MTAFSVIMFAAAVLFTVLGISIYRGKISLIHDYHRENVKEEDRGNYGRTFGIAMFVMSASLALSGVLAIVCASVVPFLAVLFAGLIVSIGIMICAQRKYNGGIF